MYFRCLECGNELYTKRLCMECYAFELYKKNNKDILEAQNKKYGLSDVTIEEFRAYLDKLMLFADDSVMKH